LNVSTVFFLPAFSIILITFVAYFLEIHQKFNTRKQVLFNLKITNMKKIVLACALAFFFMAAQTSFAQNTDAKKDQKEVKTEKKADKKAVKKDKKAVKKDKKAVKKEQKTDTK